MFDFFASEKFPSLNARDSMYDIALYFLAMLIGVRDDASLSRCWSARNRSILAARIYVEVLPIYVHATDDVFSQKLSMCLNFISSTTYSGASYPITNTSSSRSFIVNLTFGFV